MQDKPSIPPSPLLMQHDYVLLRLMEDKAKSNKVIGNAKGPDERWDAYVIAIGPGRQTDSMTPEGHPMLIKPTVKVGDKVTFNEPQCRKFELFGGHYAICPSLHIFGVIDDAVHASLELEYEASRKMVIPGPVSPIKKGGPHQ
jgi:co-chaperonin GroES (HSP10)